MTGPGGDRAAAWACTYAAIALATFAADLALTGAIDGASTSAETTLLWRAAGLAVVSLGLGAVGYTRLAAAAPTRSRQRRRHALALATALVALVVGVVRVSTTVGRTVRHVRLDRDEPLTTVSLGLQAAVAAGGAGLLLTFAARDVRMTRGTRPGACDIPQPNPTRTDVGPSGRCPAN